MMTLNGRQLDCRHVHDCGLSVHMWEDGHSGEQRDMNSSCDGSGAMPNEPRLYEAGSRTW